MTVFENLSSINVNDKIEKKDKLNYLSWVYAWGELKKRYPDATYTVYENRDGWNYFSDGSTCWVKTGVTVEGVEYIEYLPVMDYRNKSIPLRNVTSFDVNKRIQRSITKRIRRHGLGLYIYRGEDLPDTETKPDTKPKPAKREPERETVPETKPAERVPLQWQNRKCENCGKPLDPRVRERSHRVFKTHMFCSKECRRRRGFEPLKINAVRDIQNEIEKNLKGKRNS